MFKNFVKKYKLLICFLVTVIFLFPLTIYRPAESDKMAIVTSIGIDKTDNGVEVIANVLVPSNQTTASGGSVGEVKTVSGESDSLTSSIAKISLELGKMIGLAHCDAIIVSKEILQDDIIKYIDYFIRTNNLTSNAVLIVSEHKAKDVLEASAKERSSLALTLSNLIGFNKEYLFTNNTNIEKFYKNYFSPSGISILPVLAVLPQDKAISSDSISVDESNTSTSSDNGDNGAQSDSGSNEEVQSESSGSGGSKKKTQESESGTSSQSSGESGGGSSGGGESGEESAGGSTKTLKSEGKAIVIKKGKFVKELKDKEVAALNLVNKQTKKGNISAKNVNHKELKNADVNFEIYDKHVDYSCYFLEDTPIFNIDLKLILQLKEVIMENYDIESVDSTRTHLDKDVRIAIESTIHELLSETINMSKQNKVDLLNIYDYFYKFQHKKWVKYINGLTDEENYLDKVVFTITMYQHGKL